MKTRNLKTRRNNLLLLSLLVFPIASFALPSDGKQPTDIQADHVTMNRKTGVGIYRGHVQLTQGTTLIRGNQLITYMNKKNQLEKAIVIGAPAVYQTIPDTAKPLFVSVGQTIRYYPQRNLVECIGQAKATQATNSFSGPQINYDIQRDIVTSPATPLGRTKIIIVPTQK